MVLLFRLASSPNYMSFFHIQISKHFKQILELTDRIKINVEIVMIQIISIKFLSCIFSSDRIWITCLRDDQPYIDKRAHAYARCPSMSIRTYTVCSTFQMQNLDKFACLTVVKRANKFVEKSKPEVGHCLSAPVNSCTPFYSYVCKFPLSWAISSLFSIDHRIQ